MTRFFNTAGPNRSADHYTLPVMARVPEVRRLIDEGLYFILHAPQPLGKSTALLNLGHELTSEGKYVALLVSMEMGVACSREPRDLGVAELAILGCWRRSASAWLPPDLQPPPWPDALPGERIAAALTEWAKAAPRPVVLFLDEIDALGDEVMSSVLRQIRACHSDRPARFPRSIALIGLRDARDYDIEAESLTMRSFTRQEVAELYAQHSAETGQAFLPETVDRAFERTHGQPWLVNALARQLTEVVVPDRAIAITGTSTTRRRYAPRCATGTRQRTASAE